MTIMHLDFIIPIVERVHGMWALRYIGQSTEPRVRPKATRKGSYPDTYFGKNR